jgi:hypothetical protein
VVACLLNNDHPAISLAPRNPWPLFLYVVVDPSQYLLSNSNSNSNSNLRYPEHQGRSAAATPLWTTRTRTTLLLLLLHHILRHPRPRPTNSMAPFAPFWTNNPPVKRSNLPLGIGP